MSFLFATLIGLSLGLMGGGGSILTVPVLIYIVKMDPKDSIALSLAIVGVTSLFGLMKHFKEGNINKKVSLYFIPFAIGGTFFGTYLAQFIPAQIQLIIFAVIMILAAVFMFKGRGNIESSDSDIKISILIPIAIALGIMTGIIGVGGGFLIVPTLVLLAGLDMKKAVGTSLLIIAINSISGFIGYLNYIEVPWMFLIQFCAFSVAGIFIGATLIKYVKPDSLRKGFAIFLVIMGTFILYKNKDQFKAAINTYPSLKNSFYKEHDRVSDSHAPAKIQFQEVELQSLPKKVDMVFQVLQNS